MINFNFAVVSVILYNNYIKHSSINNVIFYVFYYYYSSYGLEVSNELRTSCNACT